MIEQPRLAALGVAIMVLGVLWMGFPYLRGSGADSEDARVDSSPPAASDTVEQQSTAEDDGGPTAEETDCTGGENRS
ncbi:hypothetical protein [Natronococcus occultus]|uniref:Uncharacterized protein n=1 Tax=Natronococcus occultus SP4 TaxID=694430 RepID=L0K411_9EURY|nr:hypothetical protein [Natronococcus occultus]AGB38823.1 hypothetical protein Natoc_3080 [Natronococcus occultus SP4]